MRAWSTVQRGIRSDVLLSGVPIDRHRSHVAGLRGKCTWSYLTLRTLGRELGRECIRRTAHLHRLPRQRSDLAWHHRAARGDADAESSRTRATKGAVSFRSCYAKRGTGVKSRRRYLYRRARRATGISSSIRRRSRALCIHSGRSRVTLIVPIRETRAYVITVEEGERKTRQTAGLKPCVSSATPLRARKCLSFADGSVPGGDTLRRVCSCTRFHFFTRSLRIARCRSRCPREYCRSSCAIAGPHARKRFRRDRICLSESYIVSVVPPLPFTSLSLRLRCRARDLVLSRDARRLWKPYRVFRDHYYRNSGVYGGLSLRPPSPPPRSPGIESR